MAKSKCIEVSELLAQEDVAELIAGLSFEEALELLEKLVENVESGTLSLDHSMSAYERGVTLVERLRALLSQAESKLKILNKES